LKSLVKRRYHTLLAVCRFFGCDPRVMIVNLTRVPLFIQQLMLYQRLNTNASFRARFVDLYPILHDSGQASGQIGGGYFHQDLWAARKIFSRRPSGHVDIGSRIDGFIAHLLVFMPVSFVDIRPLEGDVKGLSFVRDDATELGMFPSESIDSLSSLHAAEHFGLGRYSDPVDPGAWARFMAALQRVLAPRGRLYFSVPIGRQRVEFNAHRIFDVGTVLEAFGKLELLSFSFVGDDGRLHEDVPTQGASGIEGACGLFEFTKVP
jgi:SAM-dependent methyltransferase